MSWDSYYDPPDDDEPPDERPDCDRPGCTGDGKIVWEFTGYSGLNAVATYIPNVCEEFTLIGTATGRDCGTCHHDKECH